MLRPLAKRTIGTAILLVLALAVPGLAQDKPANNLEITHEKLKADKKLIVAKYMELTESEAKNFWPVYEEYQKDLQKMNERLGSLLQSYAAEYRIMLKYDLAVTVPLVQ